MAKQKPKAKVAATTKPKYSQAELQKIGTGYDKLGFKNSAIDMLKDKMSQHVTEWNDIVPESTMPKRPQMDTREFPLRREGYPGNLMIDFSKRTGYIKKAYEGYGEVTGKKGVSKKAYGQYKNLMEAYRKDPNLDTNISDDVFYRQRNEKEWQKAISSKK